MSKCNHIIRTIESQEGYKLSTYENIEEDFVSIVDKNVYEVWSIISIIFSKS